MPTDVRDRRAFREWLERIDEVSASIAAVIIVCPKGFSFPLLLWLIAAFALMFLYEVAWARYFKGKGAIADMYRPLGPIPIPLAGLPVGAFLLLEIWYQSPITLAAAIPVSRIPPLSVEVCTEDLAILLGRYDQRVARDHSLSLANARTCAPSASPLSPGTQFC